VAGAHPLALRVEQKAGQHARPIVGAAIGTFDPVRAEDDLGLVPEALVDNGVVLSGIALVLVNGLAAIDPVLQHEIESAARQRFTAIGMPIRCLPGLADNALRIQVGLEQPDGLRSIYRRKI